MHNRSSLFARKYLNGYKTKCNEEESRLLKRKSLPPKLSPLQTIENPFWQHKMTWVQPLQIQTSKPKIIKIAFSSNAGPQIIVIRRVEEQDLPQGIPSSSPVLASSIIRRSSNSREGHSSASLSRSTLPVLVNLALQRHLNQPPLTHKQTIIMSSNKSSQKWPKSSGWRPSATSAQSLKVHGQQHNLWRWRVLSRRLPLASSVLISSKPLPGRGV